MKNMARGTDLAKELENYRKKCLELEEKSKKDEMRCLVLEIEVEELKKKNKELEGEITRIQKVVSTGEKGKEMIVDLTDEENEGDKFVQLLIENKVLECEKTSAEMEIRSWKEKVKELVSRVCELELKANMKGMNDSSMRIDAGMVMLTGKRHLDKDSVLMSKEKVKEDINVVSTHKSTIERGDRSCSQVRKRLSFEEDGYPNKKMAPSTPGVAQPPFSGVIDISDEDVNYNEIPKVKKLSDSINCGSLAKSPCSSKNDPERTNLEHIDEDDMDGFEGYSRIAQSAKRKRTSNVIISDDKKSNDDEDMDGFIGHSSKTASAKRKRAARIITSDDDDTSYDDNAPICTLMKQHSSRLNTDSEDEVKEDVGRRHLKRLSKPGFKNRRDRSTLDLNKTVCLHGYSSSEDEEDNEEGSASEGESLGGFIVDSSESCSEIAPVSDDSSDESEDALNDFKLTLHKIGRKKVSNLKWDLEGDMLADFGKDTELCMRAVCALYRQQTADEKASKETIHHNARGFSQCDASRASKVAEFLTDGDSGGDMNKTVEELKQHDSKGIKLCMALAAKYSKQLFEIYRNKEDPYFLP